MVFKLGILEDRMSKLSRTSFDDGHHAINYTKVFLVLDNLKPRSMYSVCEFDEVIYFNKL